MISERRSRRAFLGQVLLATAGAPLAGTVPGFAQSTLQSRFGEKGDTRAKVAIVRCRSYGRETRAAYDKAFDLLGGLGSLVRNKTVTIKLNLTGTNFAHSLGRPTGETYMTHPDTVTTLCSALFAAGAKRIRLVESTNSRASLESTLDLADWDVRSLAALGQVEFENTRNLGSWKTYADLRVPGGGAMFSAFTVNRAYAETDVFVSIAKLKNHVTAGVTLAMKNVFGITPNSLYSGSSGDESATDGRFPIHHPGAESKQSLPGLKAVKSNDPGWRVPRTVAELCGARPIHLAIIDGITSVSGGEGPWCSELKLTTPGLLIAGFDPVATDAVGTALMGYENPRAAKGVKPFTNCDNHLLLAEQAGFGVADLQRIDVLGVPIAEGKTVYG